MHFSIQTLVFAVLTISKAALAIPAATSPDSERPMVFPCPEKYGVCNSCTYLKDGTLASVTRKVCGDEYNEKTCIALYGRGFLCDDNCNSCSCSKNGIISTLMLCPEYSYKSCVDQYGTKPWKRGSRLYVCNEYGVASYFPH